MAKLVTERDWKYMKGIKDELLASLCDRINKRSAAILSESACSEHEKYAKLYKHVEESDHLVATCFNDWRRSTLFMKLLEIDNQELLTPEQYKSLSKETRERLQRMKDLLK
jgi:predicted transcriptional regulator